MTSWRTLVGNSETLSAADLEDKGGHVTGTIESVTGAKFEEDAEGGGAKKVDKKALIAFVGKQLKFSANVVNCLLIEKMWGEDYEAWTGHLLTIMADKVEVKGKFFGDPCIRVKGSPELDAPMTVQIRLPRRKPFTRTLVPTSKLAAVDPVTGEVGDDDIGFDDDAPHAAEDALGAAGDDSTASEGQDGFVPGRGPKSAQGELA